MKTSIKIHQKIFIFLLIIFISLAALLDFSLVKSANKNEIQKAVDYLKLQTQDAWVTMALTAADQTGINLAHLETVPLEQQSVSTYAKYILALTSAGKNPTTFGNEDYVAKLKSFYNLEQGQFGNKDLINDDIWSILALGAIGQENLAIVQEAKNYILNYQNLDGGWGYAVSASSDSNDTAAAIMALLEAGVLPDASPIQAAIAYLKTVQNNDGGFAWSAGGDSDSASDAWAISAIYKLGQDPAGASWTKNSSNPVLHLKSLQDDDGGFWWQAPDDNKMNTHWALIALTGKYFPVYTGFNKHFLRIEGENALIWQGFVFGATALDLAINALKANNYDYQIVEFSFGLYLKTIQGEADGWMYMVDNVSAQVGSADYYLQPNSKVLFYFGAWLENGWLPTKINLTKTDTLVQIQVKYFQESTNSWQDLQVAGKNVKVGDTQFSTNELGKIELALAGFTSGFYQVFAEGEVINNIGYIRSEKESLKVGEGADDHTVGLLVEIEQTTVPLSGLQSTINFSVSPDILDFGKLKPGQSAVQDLAISNSANKIHLEAEVIGAAVFQDNLEINGDFWQFFSAKLAANENVVFPVALNIPLNWAGSFGEQQGELVLWAIQE